MWLVQVQTSFATLYNLKWGLLRGTGRMGNGNKRGRGKIDAPFPIPPPT